MSNTLKVGGNEAFKAKNFQNAIYLFSKAIDLDPNNHFLYSNRSAAHASLQEYDKALKDAIQATELKPKWAKGWRRKGAALHGQGRMAEARTAYEEALKLEQFPFVDLPTEIRHMVYHRAIVGTTFTLKLPTDRYVDKNGALTPYVFQNPWFSIGNFLAVASDGPFTHAKSHPLLNVSRNIRHEVTITILFSMISIKAHPSVASAMDIANTRFGSIIGHIKRLEIDITPLEGRLAEDDLKPLSKLNLGSLTFRLRRDWNSTAYEVRQNLYGRTAYHRNRNSALKTANRILDMYHSWWLETEIKELGCQVAMPSIRPRKVEGSQVNYQRING